MAEDLGPKSAGFDAASDMLLGCAVLRELDSTGDDGLLNTFVAGMPGGLSPTSSMLRIGGVGGPISSILRTGANRGGDFLVLGNEGEAGLGTEDGRSSPISSMLRTGERGVVKGDGDRPKLGAFDCFDCGFSRRASTSRRSSSSIASIDIGCFAMLKIWGSNGSRRSTGKRPSKKS